jgi:hypothetical protein
MWAGLVWIKIGQVKSSGKFGIDLSDSIKCWESIECPNN